MISSGAQKGISSSQQAVSALAPDDLLLNSVRQSIAPIAWIKMIDAPVRDSTIANLNALLERAPGGRLLDVECTYSISQRFNAVYSLCSLRIASTLPSAKPEDRWKERNLLYSRWVEAEIELANPARSVGGRREQWTANSGELLRRGLTMALTKTAMLVGRELALGPADQDAARSKPTLWLNDAYIGMNYAHHGAIIEGSENILRVSSPNPGTRLLLFKPGAGGAVMLEKPGNLFFTYSLDAPGA